MSVTSIARLRYRRAGEAAKPKLCSLAVPLPPSHITALRLLAEYSRLHVGNEGITDAKFASGMLQGAIEALFEEMTGLRIGEYIARLARGQRLEWCPDADGDLELREIVGGVN